MKTAIKQLSLILLILVFYVYACKQAPHYVYPQDDNISDGSGIAKKRHINYFPIEAPANPKADVPYDTFHLKLYSKVLFQLGEPILYNYYIGKPLIRLTWIRPSGYPMTLTVEEINGKMQLKENGFAPLTASDKTRHPKDTCSRIYRAKVLNFEQKQQLVDLLKKSKFFDMPTHLEEKPNAGTELAVEFHDPTNYHVVYRSVGDTIQPNSFRDICNFIIGLSNFKTEKRY